MYIFLWRLFHFACSYLNIAISYSFSLRIGKSGSDFLAVQLELSADDAVSVMLDLDDQAAEKIINAQVPRKTRATFDAALVDVVTKLILSLHHPDTLSFMSRHLCREIIFDIINGSSGREFLQSITSLQDAGEIYSINSWIKQNYNDNLE